MTPRPAQLVIVGGGNMGSALAGGLIAAGRDASAIVVVEIDAGKRAALEGSLGVRTADAPVAAEGAVIAVKPADAVAACAEVAALGTPRAVSIAAGIGTRALQEAAGAACRVVRAMPNTPALVGEGVSAIAGSSLCGEDDLAWAEGILRAVGPVVRVAEEHMDAVTAVSGSGPGYLFLVAEALVDAAVAEGIPAHEADVLVRQLLKGAGALLASSPESPRTLRERVTSPRGTTAAGLEVLEEGGLRRLVSDAVHAAAVRSAELGR